MKKSKAKIDEYDSLFYGPVLSRRFGYSLGIDLVPFKICTYDCIYCQLGPTTFKTAKRSDYLNLGPEIFKRLLEERIENSNRIDYVTFSGSGEPTLNSRIKEYIDSAKHLSDIPVLLLTGGGLLSSKSVIDDIKEADVIKVSLDAPNERLFKKINRPSKEISFKKILKGLENIGRYFKGQVWIEIMLLKGINDSNETITEFAKVIDDYGGSFEKIHINTPTRYPGTRDLKIPDSGKLEELRKLLGSKASIIKDIKIEKIKKERSANEEEILKLLKIRPSSVTGITSSLDLNRNEVAKLLDFLLKKKKIKVDIKDNRKLYYS